MATEVISNPFAGDDLSGLGTIYRTYRMDFENRRIIGMVDNADATKQAVLKAMMTRRFAYQIYDDQYGCDILNKIGNVSLTRDFMDSDIPAMVEDMLLPDETVTGLGDVSYEMLDRDSVGIECVVHTIYGDQNIEGVIAGE